MRFLQKIILNSSFCLLLFASLISCTSVNDVNEEFNKKYSREVEKYRSKRTSPQVIKNQTIVSKPPTREEVEEAVRKSTDQSYYAYVNVAEFGEDQTPKKHFPDAEVYELTKSKNPSNQLPPNMFKVTYYTRAHPPFSYSGAEFDAIDIPKKDAYGVNTRLSKKTYLLAGRNSLQKNVDNIHNHRTTEDIEMSHILIKEKKELKRKREMVRIFGKESVDLVKKENLDENKAEDTKEESAKVEDESKQENANKDLNKDEKSADLASIDESNNLESSTLDKSPKKAVN